MTHEQDTVNNREVICLTINGHTMEVHPTETVLEALERNNIEAPFNCRQGFCGVCRTKLIKGQVDYQLDPLAFIDDDEILSCCTRPSMNIEVKIEN